MRRHHTTAAMAGRGKRSDGRFNKSNTGIASQSSDKILSP